MHRKQELEIIRTLCRSGNETLAKAFAASQGYRVKASTVPYREVLQSLYTQDDAGNIKLKRGVQAVADYFADENQAEDLMLPSFAEAVINGYAASFDKAKKAYGISQRYARAFDEMRRCLATGINGRQIDYALPQRAGVVAQVTAAPGKKSAFMDEDLVYHYAYNDLVDAVGYKALSPSIVSAINAGYDRPAIYKAMTWLYKHLDGFKVELYSGLQDVLKSFETKKGKTPSKLYRGMSVPLTFATFRGNKRPVASIIQQKPTSWSKAKKSAADDDFYRDGGAGQMGVLLAGSFSPKDVLIDFSKLPFYAKTEYANEKEILIMPGTHKTDVLSVKIDQPEELDQIGVYPPWLEGKAVPNT